jgi:hypothetical protein
MGFHLRLRLLRDPRGPSPPPGLSLVPRDGWRPLPQLRPNFGGGVGEADGPRLDDRHRIARDGAPSPGPSPLVPRGEGRIRSRFDKVRHTSLPHAVCGGGPGRGAPHHLAKSLPERSPARTHTIGPALSEAPGRSASTETYSRTSVPSYPVPSSCRQNAVPLARLPPDDVSELMAVCSTQAPVAEASGLRFIDTPSVPLSEDG